MMNPNRVAFGGRWLCHTALGALVAGAAFAPGIALAQDSETPVVAEQDMASEIVVTAQRRSESIQDVPISVAAFDQEALATLGIDSTDALQFGTPGITNTQTAGDGISAIYIRGVGTGYSGPGLEGSVAFYLDDIYLQTQTSAAQAAVDVEQIEVLKGPQGTLYGRNATGGAIVVTTRDPRLGVTEGYVSAGYGNLNWTREEAVLNLPVAPTVAIRTVGYFEHRDGYVENVAFPDEEKSGSGAGETWGGRLKMLWEPDTQFRALAMFSYDRRDGNGAIHSLRYNGDGTPTNLGFYETSQSPAREGGGGDDTDALLAALTLEYNADRWTLSNTFAYRRTRAYGCTDNDGLPGENLYFCSVSQRSPNPGDADGKRDDTITNELRFVSDFGGPLDVTVGGFFERNKARFVGRIGGVNWFGSTTPTFDNHDDLTAYSVYGEVYYNLTPALRLTGGVRYTREEKYHSVLNDMDARNMLSGGGALPPAFQDGEVSFDNFSPRAVISYDAGDVNLYASYNRGFKSGGFNSPSLTLDPPLDPETIDAFEIGAKYRSPDGTLRLDTAGYYYDWKDVQVAFITGGGAGILQQNAAGSEIYGAEVNMNWAPVRAIRVNLGLAYTHARFTSFPNAAVYNIVGGALTATAEDLKGFRLPHAPDFTANGSITYNWEAAGGWTGHLTAAARYTTEYDYTAGAGGELRASRQEAFTLVDLTGSALAPDGHLEWGFFVSNLLGKEYYSLVSTGDTGVYMTPAAPRTGGVTVTYHF
ncbi:TonB-dependent receptor [Stakelama tenebrarum]|uniref:TonB-dependent receptor n=1 Tax=Stakelama tenebrarum TaxID=2711215 RepID=A0A6G6Y856_9SPHN|nr:TonB-dependent receptor [Sphingosinithalassobacter tenebrarum]QIG80756.1 TonB-dependent receptor [Sphingosinithalassobacter tenebrarum]